MIAKAPNWRIPSWYQSEIPQDYSNKWQGLKNRQQRAVWSNVIWLVAKCVTVASIRAGEETVSEERLPCGRANGFTVLPDRVYRPYIMFFLFWNMHFSHLFGERMLQLGNGAWKESNAGSTPVALNGYSYLHLIWNFSCAISEHFALLRDNSSQIIFRLCSRTSWAGDRNPNRNQVNTNTSWNKISIQISLHLTLAFMWLLVISYVGRPVHDQDGPIIFSAFRVHKRTRKHSLILYSMHAQQGIRWFYLKGLCLCGGGGHWKDLKTS